MSSTLKPTIDVIIPAFNEAKSIDQVIQAIPQEWVRQVVVVNNNSNDATSEVAKSAGAVVLDEPQQGYGFACLKGMAFLRSNPPDIVVFLDADFSDFPEELPHVVAPIWQVPTILLSAPVLWANENRAP